MDLRKPKTVKVTVYSSRNLRPKKGDGDPLAWVVFGFGKDKCCTSQIRDRNAKWNEESTFTITDPKVSLKINVKDKDDPLGQIIIPVAEIPSDEHFLKWVPLGPHKKNTNPTGELCIDCWIEDYYDQETGLLLPPSKPMKYFNKTLNRLTGKSPEAARRNKPSGSPENEPRRFSSGITSIKGSVSVEDLSSRNKPYTSRFNRDKENSLLAPAAYNNKVEIRRASSTAILSSPEPEPPRRPSMGDNGLPTIREQNDPPKILSIIPTVGPKSGGTLLQITGRNLGTSRDDITRLMVAGCNCLASLEYYAPNKIMCTTTESEGKGPITLTTKSGGMSSSKMMFEFLETKNDDESLPNENGVTDSGRSSGASDADREKDELIERIRNDNEQLKHDNRELREYIDKLVAYLMDKYPDALESSKMYR